MERWGRTLVLLAVVAVTAGGAGCGGEDEPSQAGTVTSTTAAGGATTTSAAGAGPAFEKGEADAVLEYKLVDYAFEGPTMARGPKVYFEAENTGSQEHELEVLDPDGGAVGEIAAFAPGKKGEPLAVELPAGVYTLQCLVETPDGKIHKDLGMVAELRVE